MNLSDYIRDIPDFPKAAIDLIEKSGWIVDSLNFVIILDELNWIAKLEWYKVNSLVEF